MAHNCTYRKVSLLFNHQLEKKTVPTSDRHRRRLIWPAFGRPPVLTSLPSISGQFLRLPLPVSEKAQPHSMDDPFYQPPWDRLRSPYPPRANNAASVRRWNQTLPVCPPRPPPLTFTAFLPPLMFDGRERPRQILTQRLPSPSLAARGARRPPGAGVCLQTRKSAAAVSRLPSEQMQRLRLQRHALVGLRDGVTLLWSRVPQCQK